MKLYSRNYPTKFSWTYVSKTRCWKYQNTYSDESFVGDVKKFVKCRQIFVAKNWWNQFTKTFPNDYKFLWMSSSVFTCIFCFFRSAWMSQTFAIIFFSRLYATVYCKKWTIYWTNHFYGFLLREMLDKIFDSI